jgi:hypothetical protein
LKNESQALIFHCSSLFLAPFPASILFQYGSSGLNFEVVALACGPGLAPLTNRFAMKMPLQSELKLLVSVYLGLFTAGVSVRAFLRRRGLTPDHRYLGFGLPWRRPSWLD